MDMTNHSPVGLPVRAVDCIRETYMGRQSLLPAMPAIGWSRFDRAKPHNLGGHQHADAWEICYIAKGHVDWWVNAQMFEVRPGQVFFTRPDDFHGGQDGVMHPCELYWVQVILKPDGALPGLSRQQTASLSRDLAALEHRIFPAGPTLPMLYERILAEHRGQRPHATTVTQATLITLLADVVRWGQLHSEHLHQQRSRLTTRIKHLLQWIDRHLEEPFSVTTLAKQAGLGDSQFRARFQEETGQSPVEYVSAARIARAKTWLTTRPDMPITAIAHRLGYASSQYFATAFKRRVGLTPVEYRAGHARR